MGTQCSSRTVVIVHIPVDGKNWENKVFGTDKPGLIPHALRSVAEKRGSCACQCADVPLMLVVDPACQRSSEIKAYVTTRLSELGQFPEFRDYGDGELPRLYGPIIEHAQVVSKGDLERIITEGIESGGWKDVVHHVAQITPGDHVHVVTDHLYEPHA